MFKVLIVDNPYTDEEGFRKVPTDVLHMVDDWSFLEEHGHYDRAVLAALGQSPEFEVYYYDGRDG